MKIDRLLQNKYESPKGIRYALVKNGCAAECQKGTQRICRQLQRDEEGQALVDTPINIRATDSKSQQSQNVAEEFR